MKYDWLSPLVYLHGIETRCIRMVPERLVNPPPQRVEVWDPKRSSLLWSFHGACRNPSWWHGRYHRPDVPVAQCRCR